MGYSLFPYDLVLIPHAWARETYPNLVLFKKHSVVSSPPRIFANERGANQTIGRPFWGSGTAEGVFGGCRGIC